MNRLLVIIGILVIIPLAIFFVSDADLYLIFSSPPNDSAFADQVIWITGASSGIGAALAKDLVSSGARVILSARRKEQLELVAEKCKGKYPPLIIQLDVLDYEAQKVAFENIMKTYGKLDRIVLNAGRSQRMLGVNASLEVTKDLMELNFLSFVKLATLVLPDMMEKKTGST